MTAKIAAHLILGPREEPFLEALLASIEGAVQTLIVNDNGPGPSPHTATLEGSAFGREGRLIVDRTPFAGFAAARNVCLDIHQARNLGDWIAFIDADEVHAPQVVTIAGNLDAVPPDYDFVDGYTWHFFQSFEYYTSIERRMMFFRYKPGIRWDGSVHERLSGLDGKRIALPYVYAHYGHTLAPRRHAEKGRHYSSLGAPGDVLREDQLGDFDVATYFAPEYPRLLRFSGTHPEAARATLERLKPSLRQFHDLTGRVVRAQPPAVAARNAFRRANYEMRWRGRRLSKLAGILTKKPARPGTTRTRIAYRGYMRRARPFGYALVSLAATACIVACASRGTSPLPAAPGAGFDGANRGVAQTPARDAGRRAAAKPVEVVIALQFRDEAALDRLAADVSDPNSAQFRHFLTPSQFVARFSPTEAQQRQVVDALRKNGFTITQTFANHALIDATAPSKTAERFFTTRIHDFDQGPLGTRFANVTPIRVPANIAKLVASVELNSLIYARPAAQTQDAQEDDDTATSDDDSPDVAAKNFIKNGGFEQKMKDWESCGKTAPYITTQHPHHGRFDALTGSKTTDSGSVQGWSAICQRITIPYNGKLVVYLYDVTNSPSIDSSFQAVGLMSKPGHVVTLLAKSLRNKKGWVKKAFHLTKYAGRTLYVFFGVKSSGQKKFYNQQFVDNVTITGTPATPTPTPSPTPTPTPVPTGPVGPGTDPTLTGPVQGPQNGWEPRGVADGFDFPVQHGYAGSGVTIGIVMNQKANAGDLSSFYTYNKIVPIPSLVYQTIGTDTPPPQDATEATLDIETITGLASRAKLIVYLTRDLSNQSVINAYNKVLSDGKVTILNSSFAECEAEDPSYVSTTDRLATAGAVQGITFVASAGDEGSACYNGSTNAVGVNAPASGPHFLAVGGNQSLATGPIANPVVWNDRASGTGTGVGMSGGGISAAWPIPTYQIGLAGAPQSTTKRNVPDISLPAVNADIVAAGGDQLVEGTSWSSSIATALLATTVQFCGRLGWVNPAVYSEYAASGETPYFIDITSGQNGPYAGALGKGYTAVAGYDNASGIGMPSGIKFAAKLCGRPTTLIQHR